VIAQTLPRTTAAALSAYVTQALLRCGLIAGPLFTVLAVLQALTRPGYDLRRHPISMLALGDFGWMQVASFMASGVGPSPNCSAWAAQPT
jgi:hypothetical protein